MAQSEAGLTDDQQVVFDPRRVGQHSFMQTDHKIFSAVISSLPLIQEGQFFSSGGRMHTNTG